MIDDSVLLQLKKIGMSEYEAKVYLILIALTVASAREIHDQTKIPRGKVYETISSLMQKGVIVSSSKSPVRYTPVEIDKAFDRMKRECTASLDDLCTNLKTLETESPESIIQAYELRTEWTQDNQIRMMMHRAKSEIIVLCNDERSIVQYGSDIAHEAKRLPVYLIVGNPELAKLVPIKCYTGGKDIESTLFHYDAGEDVALSMKFFLILDRRDSLTIMDENGKLTGFLLSTDLFSGYLAQKIMQEIKPIKRSRKST